MAAAGKKSKKPSDASSKPLEPLAVFIDRALGNKLVAEALRKAGVEVHINCDHFPPDAKDHEWLPEVGKRGWVLLTKDAKIRYHTIEREALINARVRAFVLISGNITGPEMAVSFVKAIPAMRKLVGRLTHPFIAKVNREGKVVIWYP